MNDMQAKPRRTLMTSRREEWIECLALGFLGHAGAVVGKVQFDVIGAHRAEPDPDAPIAVGKCVGQGIDDQIDQNLTERPGKAVELEIWFELQFQRSASISQLSPQMRKDLLSHLGSVEAAPMRLALIFCQLLERFDP